MASILKVDKLDPQSGTALEIGTSGDTISVPSGATLDISASTLTPPATMPASSGINLTALNASNLGSGTVPTARLGSGSASGTTFLAGDQTYKAAGGGKVLQCIQDSSITAVETTTDTFISTGLSITITPASTDNKILILATMKLHAGQQTMLAYRLRRDIDSAGETTIRGIADVWGLTSSQVTGSVPYAGQRFDGTGSVTYLDSPSTTSSTVYEIEFNNFQENSYTNVNGAYSGWTGVEHPSAVMVAMEIDFS